MAKWTSEERITVLREALSKVLKHTNDGSAASIIAKQALREDEIAEKGPEFYALEQPPASTWAPQAKPVDEIFYSPVLQVSQVYRDNHERIFGKK